VQEHRGRKEAESKELGGERTKSDRNRKCRTSVRAVVCRARAMRSEGTSNVAEGASDATTTCGNAGTRRGSLLDQASFCFLVDSNLSPTWRLLLACWTESGGKQATFKGVNGQIMVPH